MKDIGIISAVFHLDVSTLMERKRAANDFSLLDNQLNVTMFKTLREKQLKKPIGDVAMKLKDYFENTKGFGVLSTADNHGKVNSAIYSRPHVMEDGSLAFIMRDRLTHQNTESNPYAVYLFREEGPGYNGKRLYLTKIREEHDSNLIDSLSRRSYPSDQDRRESRFLVYFNLEKERPLVGNAE
jgi:hypothetical protein